MTWLDAVILAIIALSALYGIIRGFLREMLSLLAWALSFWAAFRYAPALAQRLETYIVQDEARVGVAFVATFLAVLVVGMILGGLMVRLARASGIDGPDRTLGALFGIARGVLLVTVLVVITAITPLSESRAWTGSGLMQYFEMLAGWMTERVRTGVDVEFPEWPMRSPVGG